MSVPTNSQDGQKPASQSGRITSCCRPAARMEFIMVSPSRQLERAVLLTRRVATGPDRHNTTRRPLAESRTHVGALEALPVIPLVSAAMERKRLSGLATATPAATRKLYFSETTPSDPNAEPDFFIAGQASMTSSMTAISSNMRTME